MFVVCPLETGGVIVQTIPNLPCLQFGTCEVVVIVSGTLNHLCFLGKRVRTGGHNQQIKGMSCTACLIVIGASGDEVSDAVPLSGHQSAIVPERHQLRICDLLNTFEVIGELVP